MNILNLAHPLTESVKTSVVAAVGSPLTRVIEVTPQFDPQAPFGPQIATLFDSLEITSAEFQTEPWLVNLPSLNYIAALVLAELHGRMGHFPAVIRLRPVANSPVTTFEFAEILDLDQTRMQARTTRE